MFCTSLVLFFLSRSFLVKENLNHDPGKNSLFFKNNKRILNSISISISLFVFFLIHSKLVSKNKIK